MFSKQVSFHDRNEKPQRQDNRLKNLELMLQSSFNGTRVQCPTPCIMSKEPWDLKSINPNDPLFFRLIIKAEQMFLCPSHTSPFFDNRGLTTLNEIRTKNDFFTGLFEILYLLSSFSMEVFTTQVENTNSLFANGFMLVSEKCGFIIDLAIWDRFASKGYIPSEVDYPKSKVIFKDQFSHINQFPRITVFYDPIGQFIHINGVKTVSRNQSSDFLTSDDLWQFLDFYVIKKNPFSSPNSRFRIGHSLTHRVLHKPQGYSAMSIPSKVSPAKKVFDFKNAQVKVQHSMEDAYQHWLSDPLSAPPFYDIRQEMVLVPKQLFSHMEHNGQLFQQMMKFRFVTGSNYTIWTTIGPWKNEQQETKFAATLAEYMIAVQLEAIKNPKSDTDLRYRTMSPVTPPYEKPIESVFDRESGGRKQDHRYAYPREKEEEEEEKEEKTRHAPNLQGLKSQLSKVDSTIAQMEAERQRLVDQISMVRSAQNHNNLKTKMMMDTYTNTNTNADRSLILGNQRSAVSHNQRHTSPGTRMYF